MIRTLTLLKQTQTRNLLENICIVLCGEQSWECDFLNDHEDPCDEGCDDCFYDDLSCSCYCKDCMENHSSNETSSEVPTTTDSLDSNEDGSNETSSEVTTTTDNVDSNEDGSNKTSSEVTTTTDNVDSNEDGSNESSAEVPSTTDTIDSNEEGSIQEINDVERKLEITSKRHRGRQNINKQTMSETDGKGKNGKSAGKKCPPRILVFKSNGQ